jgi:tetratricopeptide (TPR) repeat protein
MAALAPTSPDANYSHGWAALANNRFEEALGAFGRIDRGRGWMKDWPWFARWPTTAHHFLGDFVGELAESRRAQKQFPNEAEVCISGLVPIAALGRVDQLETAMARCESLPGMGTGAPIAVRQVAASELIAHGHTDAARPLCDTVITLIRQLPDSSRFKPMNLASAFAQCGRWADARPIYERELTRDPGSTQLIGHVGVAAGFLGDRRTAEAMIRRIPLATDSSAEGKGRKRQVLRQRARIAAALGDKEQAVALLREAVDLGTVPVFGFHRDRALEALRGYAPYEQLYRPRE